MTEQHAEGGVDATPVAVEVDDAEQLTRQLHEPGAVLLQHRMAGEVSRDQIGELVLGVRRGGEEEREMGAVLAAHARLEVDGPGPERAEPRGGEQSAIAIPRVDEVDQGPADELSGGEAGDLLERGIDPLDAPVLAADGEGIATEEREARDGLVEARAPRCSLERHCTAHMYVIGTAWAFLKRGRSTG